VKTKMIPIAVGTLGTVPEGLEKNMNKAEKTICAELFQKTTLPGTAHIIKRVHESSIG